MLALLIDIFLFYTEYYHEIVLSDFGGSREEKWRAYFETPCGQDLHACMRGHNPHFAKTDRLVKYLDGIWSTMCDPHHSMKLDIRDGQQIVISRTLPSSWRNLLTCLCETAPVPIKYRVSATGEESEKELLVSPDQVYYENGSCDQASSVMIKAGEDTEIATDKARETAQGAKIYMSQQDPNKESETQGMMEKGKQFLEGAKEKLTEYAQDANEKAEEFTQRAKDTTEEAKDKAGETAQAAKEKGEEYTRAAKDKAGEATEEHQC